jgi:predicted CoA-binding protein
VPDTLAGAGYAVFVKNGPGPEDFNPAPPEHIDLVYCHRPLEELPGIVAQAKELGAQAVWCQSPSPEARRLVESAGLRYFGEEYIADAVRRLSR